MSRYKPYPSYKDSGVEWIGQIPAHWAVGAVKREFDAQLGKMLQPEPRDHEDVLVPYHKAVSVQWENVSDEAPEKMWASPADKKKYGIKKGDLLICEGGDVGRAAVFNGDEPPLIIQNSLHRVRPKKNNKAILLLRLMQVLKRSEWLDVLCSKSTIVHFTAEKLGDLPYLIAPENEQDEIIAKLDRETTRIDALIAKKTQFIELLKEKRQVLITHAVTKGLNPNVKMKDSGVAWIGEVPEHWEIGQLKRLVTFYNGKDHKDVETTQEDGFPVYGSGGQFAYASDYLYDGESVLFGRKGTINKPLYVNEKFWTVDTMYWTKILPVAHGRFCFYVSKTIPFEYYATNTALPSMTQSELGSHAIAIPPRNEQALIADTLDNQTSKIDSLIRKSQSSIYLLKERRSAFITAAVTGQIDLRSEANQ